MSDYSGRWLVLYFYPKDDTPGCTQEACRFRDDIGVLGDLGCHILDLTTAVAGDVARARCHLATFPKIAADGQPVNTNPLSAYCGNARSFLLQQSGNPYGCGPKRALQPEYDGEP